jgi:repressor LexA
MSGIKYFGHFFYILTRTNVCAKIKAEQTFFGKRTYIMLKTDVRKAKAQEILDYIKSKRDRSYPPSIREIGAAVGLKSPSSVKGYLDDLTEAGLIRRDPSVSRGIEVIDSKESHQGIIQVPLIGTVAAGIPILAVQNIEEYIPFSASVLHGLEHCYALRVKGESMINAGILPDDILLVNQQPTVENGEIAVALVDDSATVKRFYKENGYYRLQPENDSMDPIIVDHVDILGKVIGLYRRI